MAVHALVSAASDEELVIKAEDLREIARLTNASSSRVARNAFFVEQIANDAAAEADLVDGSASMLDEMSSNMEGLVAAARRSLQIAQDTGETSAGAARIAGEALRDLEATATTMEHFDRMVGGLWTRVEGIGGAIEAIQDISERSHLLSINANIEAAHAGEWGRTFAVIAREIGKLAQSTTSFTAEIEALLRAIRSEVEAIRSLSQETLETTVSVRNASQRVEEALGAMSSAATVNREQATTIAAAAAQQAQAVDHLLNHVRDVARGTASTLRAIGQLRELQIGDLNSQLYSVIGRYRIGGFVEHALEIGERAAREVEEVFETGLARGRYTLDELFDPKYRELRGSDVLMLSRLFDVRRASESFDPPKFGTSYDATIDRELCSIVDRYTEEHRDFSAVCVIDNNSFHIAHSRLMRAPITGDPATDRANNRVKRIFDGRTALRCGRVGLPGAEDLPPRIGRRAFEAAAISLRRPAGPRPYLVQSYARDTGEVFGDLSIAIYVRDLHYGALSIAYPADTV
jgi:methyl-accepting chemotaxis protein